MSDAQLRATRRYRERRRKRGLKRVEVPVPSRETAVIRKAAAVLRGPANEAKRLREPLGFNSEPGTAPTALDVFAMEESMSPHAEALWDEAIGQVQRERRDASLNRPRKVDL